MRESMSVSFLAEVFDVVFVRSSVTKELDNGMPVSDRATFAASPMPLHAGV